MLRKLQEIAALQAARQHDLDHEWALSDPQILKDYAGKFLAVCRRKVWGSGKDFEDALADARRQANCPDRDDLTLVAVPENSWIDASFFAVTGEAERANGRQPA
jgi:hypothetical protein